MKKQITILILLFFSSLLTWSQSYFVKTDIPCDKELLKKTPGRWMPTSKTLRAKASKQQEQEIIKRLDPIHQWVFNIYRSPMAFDAVTSFYSVDDHFASQLKIERDQYGAHESYVNGTPTIPYSYSVGFCAYHCGRNNYEIMRGAGCENGTNMSVTINSLGPLTTLPHLSDFDAETMRIDNRPIRMMYVLSGKKWKGYDLYVSQTGLTTYYVLLHRDGILPYIPVTRKEYLDRSIQCLQKFFDKTIKASENPEGLAALMDKKEKDEQVRKLQKHRDDVLKYYRDELEATTKAGLLDTPAIIFGGIMNMHTSYPIFIAQDKGGIMLVTENPAYMKKDLPKYIPQLIVYSMWDGEDGPDPALNPYHLYYQNFPIEKLQAMIDK
jgi:hypothetical protein